MELACKVLEKVPEALGEFLKLAVECQSGTWPEFSLSDFISSPSVAKPKTGEEIQRVIVAFDEAPFVYSCL